MTVLFRDDPISLLQHWSIDADAVVIPASAGTNNQSFRIETARQSYILRISSDVNAKERIAQEMLFLNDLQRFSLPFRTPESRQTTANEPFLVIEGPNTCCVTLFEAIPGVHATARHAEQAWHCGEALGRLDTKMQEIDSRVASGMSEWLDVEGLAQFAIHDGIDLPVSVQDNVDHIMGQLATGRIGVADEFAMQPIHCDYFPSNVLVEGNDVSGILDFEYAAMGPAVLDLAIGLWTFGSAGEGFDWPVIEAFAAGYATARPIRNDEIEAIPVMILLREAGSLMHWTGRYRQGLIAQEEVKERVERLLHVERVVTAGEAELVDRVGLAVEIAKT